MKHCAKCGDQKAEDDFYKRDRTCKECRKRMVRDNRSAKIDYYRLYDRQRGNDQNRVSARLDYLKTERGRETSNQAKRRYIERNKVKGSAHNALNNAIRDNKLIKPPCCTAPDCFNTKNIQAHHPDYEQPLSVVWLCSECHSKLHREFREMIRKSA
ncbi:TPA: hypothetical protein ACU6E5_004295 [Pseudomonas aeruginosa]